jgi:hypothetical protein
LYVLDYKVPALFCFFFFITSGFNLVPEEVTKTDFISKGSDYAFFITLGIVLIDLLFGRKNLKLDDYSKCLVVFGIFLAGCILFSRFSVGLGWSEIIRTCRYQFFWMLYFIFRGMSKTQLETLLRCLFVVTLFTSVLFLIQIFIDEWILIKTVKTAYSIFGIRFPRYYNQPDMLYFFTFMAIYKNPFKGMMKYLTIVIFVAALLGSFHRSLAALFIISVGVGYILRLPRLRRVQVLTAGLYLSLVVVSFVGYKFVHSRTFVDLKTVLSGDVLNSDIDMNDLRESTFTFRIAHFLERNQYLLDHPTSMLVGAGLIPEDSKRVDTMFDFDIGIVEELTGETAQLDTSDISYSVLLIRYGYLGTFLNLVLFVYLMVFFYKRRENDYGFFSFLFFIMTFGTSFFSSNLAMSITFLMPLITYHIIKKTEEEEKEEEPVKILANE